MVEELTLVFTDVNHERAAAPHLDEQSIALQLYYILYNSWVTGIRVAMLIG